MKKVMGAAAVLMLVGSLVAGCDRLADDDCDARGLGIELTAVHAGKGGGSRSGQRGPSLTKPGGTSGKSSGRPGGSRPRTGQGSSHGSTSHGPRHKGDDDWWECDD